MAERAEISSAKDAADHELVLAFGRLQGAANRLEYVLGRAIEQECGISLSDPDTYRRLAHAAGLDAEPVVEHFQSPGAAEPDFARATQLGVNGFPTLLAIQGNTITVLARGHATADQVDQRLAVLPV